MYDRNSEKTKVSVIIPTCNRPTLLEAALESVVNQSYKNIEVVIVLDKASDETKLVVEKFNFLRTTVVESDIKVGGAQARNLGVNASDGDFIAFLDDDDEWAPDKIKFQLEMAEKLPEKNLIIGCQIVAVHGDTSELLASLLPKINEPLWQYLFERRAFSSKKRQIQTSTLFMNRSLAVENPFRKIERHQDWDFLLRAEAFEEFVFVMLPKPLVKLNVENDRPRISTTSDDKSYLFSINWINSYDRLISGRARADFILTVVADRALKSKNYRAAFGLIFIAFKSGIPGIHSLLVWLAMCVFPRR